VIGQYEGMKAKSDSLSIRGAGSHDRAYRSSNENLTVTILYEGIRPLPNYYVLHELDFTFVDAPRGELYHLTLI
jgi:hypothetical protein